MDFLGVNKKGKRQTKRSKKDIKVVYISTPMKVKTSAPNFRAIVQELTGKDSDTTRFVDFNSYLAETSHDVKGDLLVNDEQIVSMENSYPESSTSPDSSPFEPFGGSGLPSVDGSFMDWFDSSFLFRESSPVGVLN